MIARSWSVLERMGVVDTLAGAVGVVTILGMAVTLAWGKRRIW